MLKLSEDKRNTLVEISTALAISLVFFLFSFTPPYQRLELLSLDARFNLRPPIAMNPDIATIDIDDRALSEEGRWQDWKRDKHTRVIDAVRLGAGAQLGFDIYFSEESKMVLYPSDVVRARSLEEVRTAFRDYDAELATAARRAKNVFLAATFVVEEFDRNGNSDYIRSSLSEESWGRVGSLLEKDCYLEADDSVASSFLTASWPQAIPIPSFIEASRGVGFAQIAKETDGLVRKYPTFLQIEYPPDDATRRCFLIPSLGLLMACDYLQVPLETVNVIPGACIVLPNAQMPDGSRLNLRIPIDAKGQMIINWAGDYKETFRHYPYSSVIRLSEHDALSRIKEFLSRQDDSLFRDPSLLMETVRTAFPQIGEVPTYVACLYGAFWYETLIENDGVEKFEPHFYEQLFGMSAEDVPELYESQREVFENVKLHHQMLEMLSQRPGASLSDVRAELELSLDAVENAYMTIKNMVSRGGPKSSERPLFFLPPVVLENRVITLEDLKGGVFFYGLTATGTHDLNPMPFSPRYPMVGAIANVFNTIVTGQFITPLGKAWRLPIFLVVGLFTGYILSTRTTIRGSFFTILFLIAYLLFAYWLFVDRRIWIDVIGPAGTIIVSDAAIVWYKFNTAEKKRKFIKSAFEHYMNPSVVEEIARNPDMLELGGKEMRLTAFFSDVAGFTTLSEQLSAPEVVELLNEYLTAMTDIVLKYDGTLDKYEGDAIMAVFGAPIHFADHAARACFVALEMQEKLSELRPKWRAEGKPELEARIGINTGSMVVGNMGSRTRFDYTVMGDAVNLAARLEGVNKQYSTQIMISEFTYVDCRSEMVVREIDLIRVKGKAEPVRIYEVVARSNDNLGDDMKAVLEHYSGGLRAYRERDWETGIDEFKKALGVRPEDGPSLTYLKRCEEYRTNPPPDDWGGVYVMTTK